MTRPKKSLQVQLLENFLDSIGYPPEGGSGIQSIVDNNIEPSLLFKILFKVSLHFESIFLPFVLNWLFPSGIYYPGLLALP